MNSGLLSFSTFFGNRKSPDPTLIELASAFDQVVLEDDDTTVIGSMFRILDEIENRLADSSELHRNSSSLFGEVSFLKLITLEFLKYAIEDEGIDIRDHAPRIMEAFKDYLSGNSGLDKSAIWEVYEDVVRQEPIRVKNYLVTLNKISFIASIPVAKDQLVPVSTSQFPIVPILEETIAEADLAGQLSDAYRDAILRLSSEFEVSHLCCIEKAVGPVGAIGLFGSVVEKTGLLGCIYRETYFAKRGRVTGAEPQKGANVVLVYDLMVSGHALLRARSSLQKLYDVNVAGAVVLLNYSGKDYIGEKQPLKLYSLANYSDIQADAENIHNGMVDSTKKIIPVDKWRADVASQGAVNRLPVVDPAQKEVLMEDHPFALPPIHNPSYVKIAFDRIDEYEKAVRLFYEDDELVQYDIGTLDGITLNVHPDSLSLLRERDVEFYT